MLSRAYFFFTVLSLFLILQSCGSSVSPGLTPKISSEDAELDQGGSDIPLIYSCEETFPKLITLYVTNIENGLLIQNGLNGPQNPAILDIGNIYGSDPNEPLTRINLNFVTDSTEIIVGSDPDFYRIFLHLILFDFSAFTEFLTDYLENEPVYNSANEWIGNRVATWHDDLALFDGLLNINETYILQSCRGFLFQTTVGNITGSSQPLYIQARLTGTY